MVNWRGVIFESRFSPPGFLERPIRWVSDKRSAYLFVARLLRRAEERRDLSYREITKHNVGESERRRASGPDSAGRLYRGGNFFRDTPRLVHARSTRFARRVGRGVGARDRRAMRAVAPCRAAPHRARVSWYLGAHAGGEPRSRIAWNLVSRSAISVRNARRRCTYVRNSGHGSYTGT